MAWTAPMTVVASQVWTATQFNEHVRDNLLETAPAKATTAGSIFNVVSANSIQEVIPSGSTVATSQTTTSTTYTDLTTVGPTVTVDTGTTATVIFSATLSNNTLDIPSYMSVEVSGASTVAASDTWCTLQDGVAIGSVERALSAHRFTGLSEGTNTFTCKYRVGANTGTFADRHLIVIPL